MKYIIVVADGMADHPIKALNGKTPLEAADCPYFDYIASHGIFGRLKTVPDGMVPESDTANLAIMGYDPKVYSHGRSPLEAMSIGIDMNNEQTAIRANLVCLSDLGESYEEKTMLDHSAGEISAEEARVLISYCDKMLCKKGQKLYTGVGYRNCLIYDNAPPFTDFSRPHDILGRCIHDYLPRLPDSKPFLDMMKASFDLLNNHTINIKRANEGKRKANSLWFWSPGKKPIIPSFKEKTGLNGSVICAVDLIKGIGKCAKMDVPFVMGATGGCTTDYTAKANAALYELIDKNKDFVYVHVEAPDECGHKGDINAKIKSIESIDEKIVGSIMNKLDSLGESYTIAVLPDHPTPIAKRTHTSEPVPFAVYSSNKHAASGFERFTEANASQSHVYINSGHGFIDFLLNR